MLIWVVNTHHPCEERQDFRIQCRSLPVIAQRSISVGQVVHAHMGMSGWSAPNPRLRNARTST